MLFLLLFIFSTIIAAPVVSGSVSEMIKKARLQSKKKRNMAYAQYAAAFGRDNPFMQAVDLVRREMKRMERNRVELAEVTPGVLIERAARQKERDSLEALDALFVLKFAMDQQYGLELNISPEQAERIRGILDRYLVPTPPTSPLSEGERKHHRETGLRVLDLGVNLGVYSFDYRREKSALFRGVNTTPPPGQ